MFDRDSAKSATSDRPQPSLSELDLLSVSIRREWRQAADAAQALRSALVRAGLDEIARLVTVDYATSPIGVQVRAVPPHAAQYLADMLTGPVAGRRDIR